MTDEAPRKLDAHLFVCTNRREGGSRPSCAAAGGEELRDALKRRCKERGWQGRVRVNASGCLDRCEEGCVAVLYPEGRWFTRASPSSPGSVDEIERAIEETLSRARKP